MRISNHKLAIEMGLFSKLPRNERTCLFCKANNITALEDEQHVLLQCSRLTDIRRALFDHVRKSRTRIDSLSDKNKLISF